MKHTHIIAIAALAFMAFACSSPETLTTKLTGTWDMYGVYEAGSDVTAKHNPEGNRYMIFKKDGTFESGGDPFGKNTGQWSINEKTGVLFIDSDSGEEDDSNWNISFEDGKTVWTGIGTEWQQSFKLEHTRRK